MCLEEVALRGAVAFLGTPMVLVLSPSASVILRKEYICTPPKNNYVRSERAAGARS
jgi:hypothetical protein